MFDLAIWGATLVLLTCPTSIACCRHLPYAIGFHICKVRCACQWSGNRLLVEPEQAAGGVSATNAGMRAIESLYMVIWMSILTPLVSPVTRKSTAINILRTTDPLNPTQRPDDGDNPGSATEPSSTHSPEYYTATDDSHTTDAKMTDSNERVISAATTGPVNTTDNFTMGESHADDNSSIPSFSLPLSSSTGVVPTTETAAAANSPLASGSRASGAPSAGDVLGRGRSQSDEERLLDYLFKDYNPSARPVINSSKTVPVRMQFSLMHFQELVSTNLHYFAEINVYHAFWKITHESLVLNKGKT